MRCLPQPLAWHKHRDPSRTGLPKFEPCKAPGSPEVQRLSSHARQSFQLFSTVQFSPYVLSFIDTVIWWSMCKLKTVMLSHYQFFDAWLSLRRILALDEDTMVHPAVLSKCEKTRRYWSNAPSHAVTQTHFCGSVEDGTAEGSYSYNILDLHGIYGENHGYTMCFHIWWVMSEVSIGWYSKLSNWCPTNAWPMDILQWLTWTKACPSSKKSMRAWKVQESWQNSWIVLNRFEPLWDLTVPGCGVGLGTNFSAHGLNACLLLKSGKQGRKFRKRRDLNAEARQNASHSFSLYLSHLLRLCHKFQLNCHVAAGFKTLVSSESLWVTQLQALEIGFFVGF